MPLENHRHEKFAQELAAGKGVEAAYRAAGYTDNRRNASRLKARPKVSARLAELREKRRRKTRNHRRQAD